MNHYTYICIICLLSLYLLRLLYKHNQTQHQLSLLKTELEQQTPPTNELNQPSELSAKQLFLLLNTFQDALIISNKSHTIQFANTAAKALCSKRTIQGKTLQEALLNDTITSIPILATKTNSAQTQDCILYSSSFGNHSSESETSWHIYSAPLSPPTNPSTNPASSPENSKKSNAKNEHLYATIIRDTTAEHRSNNAQRDFIANASHELRTPLTIINGYLENLIEDDLIHSPETAQKFLTIIQKHSTLLSRIIEEMLTISKLESNNHTLVEKTPFNLHSITQDVIDQLTPMIEKQHAEVSSLIPQDYMLTGDPFYWKQILFNLIENALKQNPQAHTKIKIKATTSNQSTLIEISDNGIGIPDADIPFIFDRFYRVQKHHSKNEIKGTGLGLSIVKHALHAQGANITVQSEPGIKTTFRIQVPTI